MKEVVDNEGARHCERSEAIQPRAQRASKIAEFAAGTRWIASSQELLAMTAVPQSRTPRSRIRLTVHALAANLSPNNARNSIHRNNRAIRRIRRKQAE
jgi:hypothetical protein